MIHKCHQLIIQERVIIFNLFYQYFTLLPPLYVEIFFLFKGTYPKRDRHPTDFFGHVWPSDFPCRLWYNERLSSPKIKKRKIQDQVDASDVDVEENTGDDKN